jgi:glyceraldehyde-3-phosphate dehydrogenase/erythrose-4-phosphate dehydrogenase
MICCARHVGTLHTVAINSFGWIGRSAFRPVKEKGAALEIVPVNDLADSATLPTCARSARLTAA